MITPRELVGAACDTAATGSTKGLPADLAVRRMVADLQLYAESLLSAHPADTVYGVLFATDQIYWRACRLVALATLPQAPTIQEQEDMRGMQLQDSADRSVFIALREGQVVDVDMVAAAFDGSPSWAQEVLTRSRRRDLSDGE